jgi:PAS domain S-box-containing protein
MEVRQKTGTRRSLLGILESRPDSTPHRYFAALMTLAVATGLRFAFQSSLHGSGFAFYWAAAVIAGWLGGLGPCLLVQIASLVLSRIFFQEPDQSPEEAIRILVGLSAFFFSGIMAALLSDATREARMHAERETEDAIQQKEQLRTTIECVGEAVIVTDDHGRLTMINRVAEELTGCTAAEAIGHPAADVFQLAEDDPASLDEQPISAVLREHRNLISEAPVILVSRSGQRRAVSFSAAPIADRRGHTMGVVLTFRDETERQQAVQALRDADRRKDNFLAVLAHELRNPLAPIGNALEILRTPDLSGSLRDESRLMMQRQFDHLVRLVDDLLDVSRIARGKIELRMEDVLLKDIVQRAVEAAGPFIESEGHTLRVDLPDEPLRLHGDPVRLTQAITNLLNNAARYTDGGGRIAISARREESRVILSVEDNGIGIAADELPKIFGLFMQVDQGRERVSEGMGVGLTLVKNIIQMHGGSIEARSEGLGKGAEFLLRLPLSQVVERETPPVIEDQKPAPIEAPRKLLVVDDNIDAATSLARLLRMKKHVVHVAHNGPDALNSLDADRPDIMIMDIGMPGMDGYEVAQQVRRRPGGDEVILVALTGWGGAEDRQRSLQAQFDHHLVKPLRLEDLQPVIAQTSRTVLVPGSPPKQSMDSFFFAS